VILDKTGKIRKQRGGKRTGDTGDSQSGTDNQDRVWNKRNMKLEGDREAKLTQEKC
jgi:hypothetical protein